MDDTIGDFDETDNHDIYVTMKSKIELPAGVCDDELLASVCDDELLTSVCNNELLPATIELPAGERGDQSQNCYANLGKILIIFRESFSPGLRESLVIS